MIAPERKNYNAEPAAHAVAGAEVIPFPGLHAARSTWEPLKFFDATALTPFNPADPVLATQIIVTQGANAKSNDWKPVKADIGTMLNHLIKHEVGPKDGKAWVLADMVQGARTKNGVKAMYAAGLDIDTGMGGAAIDAEMAKLGHLGVRYTTHSHMKGETRVKKDLLIAWGAKHCPGLDADPENVELIRAYLREARKYDPAVADTAELLAIEHVTDGIEAVIEHAPMAKHRVIVFLAEPFDIAREGRTQKEALDRWRKIPQALARKLGNLPIDSTGSDPNRLFFLPRHAKGAPFEISLFGGSLLDWRTLELDDPLEALAAVAQGSSGPKSVTPEGRALAKWSRTKAEGFAIVDVLRDHAPEKIRNDLGAKIEIECPFDDDHSNSGDTDDRACFAVSAGEGVSPIFIVSCRHDGCRDKTNLDMLGKMIEDEWFEEPVIHDESYNALADEGASTTPVSRPAKPGAFGRPAGIYEDRDELVQAMAGCASIVLDGADLKVVVEINDQEFVELSERAAKTWFKTARLVERGPRGGVNYTNALDVYLCDPARLEFVGFTPNPNAPRRGGAKYSTWRGFALKGVQGQCGLMKKHLKDVICGGNESDFNWLFSYLAQMIQDPGQKLNTCIVTVGPKGAGKSTVAEWLRRMIGARHSRLLSQSRHVVGNFNEHIRDAVFVQIEEAVWAGNKEAEGVLKSLISDERLTTEAKGGKVLECDNYSRLWINSNEDWVIPAGEGERRYLVLSVVDPCPDLHPDHADRKAYHDALRREADAGGVEALMYELEHHDYSAVDLRRPPMTDGLKAQMRESLSDDANWLHDAVISGEFTTRDGLRVSSTEWPWDAPYEITTARLLESFRDNIRTYNGAPASSKRMAKSIKAMGAVEKRLTGPEGARPPGYVLPARRALADRLVKTYGLVIDMPPAP